MKTINNNTPENNKKFTNINTFGAWFDNNMIYNKDTKSFVCRLFEDTIFTRNEVQNKAFKVMKEMREEYERKTSLSN